MKKFFAMCLLTLTALAQQPSPVHISYDIAKFRGDQNTDYLEIYYSFEVSRLKYLKTNDSYQSEAVISALIKRSSDDSVVSHQAWRIPFSITDTTMLQTSRTYSDLFGFLLKPDVYRVYIVTGDMNDASVKDSVSFLIDLDPFTSDKVMLSDIELCSSIHPSERDSSNRFYKNTFEVKPNPSKIFGFHQPALFYYLETYNLKTLVSDQYLTKAVITNAVGKEVLNHEKVKKKNYESNVEVGILKVHELRSGVYTLKYSIVDSSTKAEYSTSKRFFVYNPSLPTDTLVATGSGSIDASVFATMSEEEIDKEILYVRYIASKEEIDRFAKLKGIDAKRRSLYEFWENRDEDRVTPFNETRQEYLRRVAYANQQYRTGFKEGWKTDRGRVYIVYGPCDDTEHHANETDMKPYEIWYYNSIQGGVQFVFGDRTGFSDYILLHSTHRNEIRDDNWQNQLQAN